MDNYQERINNAANFCLNILRQACVNDHNQTDLDRLISTAATFTGIATAVTAKDPEFQSQFAAESSDEGFLYSVQTEVGDFWFGDALNIILFNHQLATWNLAKSLFETKGYGDAIPNVEEMLTELVSNVGDPDFCLWNGKIDPYEEQSNALHAYQSICTALSETEISKIELQIAFSFALVKALEEYMDIFSSDVDMLKMAMETVLFYAHMDI